MPIGDQIDIPNDVLVRCPLVHFAQRRAASCAQCAHFAGLTEQLNGPHPFARLYALRCAHPVDRELSHLIED
jgi:hypothetical protein